jgi:hypothetical protein
MKINNKFLKIFLLCFVCLLICFIECTGTSTSTSTNSKTSTHTSTATKTSTKTNTKSTTKTQTHSKTKTNTKTLTKTNTATKSTLQNQLSFRQNMKMSFLNKYKAKSSPFNNSQPTNYHSPILVNNKVIENFAQSESMKKKFWNGYSLYEGWVKTFRIINGVNPGSFKKNVDYERQMAKDPDLNLQELDPTSGVYKNIPGPEYFYMALFEDHGNISENFLYKRESTLAVLCYYSILPIQIEASNIYKGGVEDLKKVSEGYCFMIKTETQAEENKKDIINIVLCFDKEEEKYKAMKIIRDNRLLLQQKQGIFGKVSDDLIDKASKKGGFWSYIFALKDAAVKPKDTTSNLDSEGNRDGYWKELSGWSQCSVKCGGGEKVYQRMCIPPLGNGKPCEGQSILKEKCNLTPCTIVSF